jgi:rhodanese-related sulfurtransferase
MRKSQALSVSIVVLVSMALASASGAEELKGRVKSVSSVARAIAVELENKSVVVVKFDGSTQFKNAASSDDFIPDEVVAVDYSRVGTENRAKTISKVIAPPPAGVTRISAAALRDLVRTGGEKFLLVDSRPAGRYNEAHLPGAVSVPLDALEKAGEKLLPADRGTTLVFYCGGLSCGLSPKSAAIAVKLGFKDVRMFPEGEPGWKKLAYPLEASLTFVKTGNIVLVDLRSAEKASAGHIPRAVNIPAPALSGASDRFPEYTGAPVVFYSDNESELNAALELMRDWGYPNATVFPGGANAWRSAGNQLVNGPAPTKIQYARKLADGEVSIKEFEEIVKLGSRLVIDARTAEEFGKGHFPKAMNIPSEEIAVRYAEIPAGTQAVIHCSTGTRAEMAYDVLKERGIKAQYLAANVEFASGNKWVIQE